MKLTRRTALVAALTALCVSGTAQSQDPSYPSRLIRIVAPFGAGGGGDTSLRMLGTHLSKALGQTVVVDNKPGANGVIGAQDAARSPADGYTLFYGSTTTLAANPSLMKKLPYDPVKDFAAIAQVSDIPFMLVVNPELGATTVAQVIALAKGGKPLSFASANSTGQVAGSVFAKAAGVQLLHVPYKASPAALTDLVGGQVQMMFVDVASGLPLVKAGKLLAIGMTTSKRSVLLPDVPAIAEALPGFEVVGWTALTAPAGTRPEIVSRLNAEVGKILAQPDVKSEFERAGFEVHVRSPDQTTAYIASEKTAWGERIRAAGIEAE